MIGIAGLRIHLFFDPTIEVVGIEMLLYTLDLCSHNANPQLLRYVACVRVTQ